MIYDVIVVGGGPAGVAAVVYCARKQLKTLLITETFGGQSYVASDIQNWIGEKSISGFDLAKKLEEHARNFPDVVDIVDSSKVNKISTTDCEVEERECDFKVQTESGESYTGRAVIIASGARRRKLGVSGEDKFEGKGVSYCSTCDAPIFKGKDVVVVGGGNAGLETVIDLFPYAKQIYLLERGDALRGDQVSQAKIKEHGGVKIITNVEVQEVVGDKLVESILFKDLKSDKIHELKADGMFVAIGSVPNSEIVKGLVDLDKFGQIITDGKHSQTSHPGIFAAGDVTDDPYKQNNISAGDGVRAALATYAYIEQRKKAPPTDG